MSWIHTPNGDLVNLAFVARVDCYRYKSAFVAAIRFNNTAMKEARISFSNKTDRDAFVTEIAHVVRIGKEGK